MKKLLLFFSIVVLFISCCNNDCIGQPPPPIPVYVDSNCVAIMPNVIPFFDVDDNCDLSSVLQTPLAGTEITPPLTGTIQAADGSGNITTVEFQVIKVDTISPTIKWVGDIALKPDDFDEAAEHYTKWLAIITRDINYIRSTSPFEGYPTVDGSEVWYNCIVIM